MSNVEWDSKTVIGQKAKAAKVARNASDLNAARRAGAVVGTDKKVTGGLNKAHQGAPPARSPSPNCSQRHCFVAHTCRLPTAVSLSCRVPYTGTDHQKIAKLDRENEVAPPSKINPAVGKAMQTARMEKQLSQKDVAQKINEKPSVLQDYEAGRAIPNPQILSKLERVLGVKLRGNDIGKPLGGPKKS
ncbi:transcription factor [Ganoderma sinense ZZ0214-1]|uniref:Transcription factor n=1 Tax=Ganoderma sinense ZZ0214-1 TaxID=1077348 RepID=A0A2G8RQG6_9APHY|nr:transcription factor [Ganoderma sinense ZZ0214-1]